MSGVGPSGPFRTDRPRRFTLASSPPPADRGSRPVFLPAAAALLLCGATFAYDVATPPFHALGVAPYVLAVLLVHRQRWTGFPFLVAGFSTVLGGIGPVVGGHPYSHALLVNRLVMVIVLWAAAWLVWRWKRATVAEVDHRRALEALGEERRRLSLFLERVPAILWAVDHDLRFTHSTGAGLGVLDLEPGQAVGSTLQEFFGTDDPGFPSIAAHQRVLETGGLVSFRTEWGGRHYRVHLEPVGDGAGAVSGIVGLALDVTDQQRAEESARLSESRYRRLFEEVQEAVYVSTLDGEILEANAAFLEMFGLSEDELGATDVLRLYADPGDRDRFRRAVMEEGSVRDFELRLRSRDARPITVLLSSTLVRNEAGEPIGFQGILRDVTRQRDLEGELRHRALHDSLTDLPNRVLLHDRVALGLERYRRDGRGLALLFVDLDGFKRVNDSLGHQAGDTVLKRAARRLGGAFRGHDTVARVGGDEFIVLLTTLRDEAEATAAAERLTSLLVRPVPVEGEEVHLSASVGVVYVGPDATWPEEATLDPDRLVRAADMALYRAKRRPGPGFELFRPAEDWTRYERDRLRIENDIRGGLETDAFLCHYQPIVSLKTGEEVGAEVLARWRHPERGLVLPAEFIPVSEQTGLILSVGEATLRRACLEAADWKASDGEPLSLFFNLSPRQFDDPELVTRVRNVLEETGTDPSRLVFEVTETGAMLRPEHTVLLKELGCRVALDDFGTGYASLHYLKTLSLDVLKLDMTFTHGLPDEPLDLAICRAVTTLGRHLGVLVVAEGIESEAQFEAARSVGCGAGQGYYLGRPVPPAALEERLAASGSV